MVIKHYFNNVSSAGRPLRRTAAASAETGRLGIKWVVLATIALAGAWLITRMYRKAKRELKETVKEFREAVEE